MRPLYGLVLAGGVSRRMGADKAALDYHGRAQLGVVFDLVTALVPRCFVSVRVGQVHDPVRAVFPQIVDMIADGGPASGLLAAHAAFPEAAWLVVACDLPMVDRATLEGLLGARGTADTVAYRSETDGLPEPLCALWEPEALRALAGQVADGRTCPRKCLLNAKTHLLTAVTPGALDNINTPQERVALAARLERVRDGQAAGSVGPAVGPVVGHEEARMTRIRLEYFAQLREVAGRETETIETAHRTVGPLYEELRDRYGFPHAAERLRVAINGDFAPWDQELGDGDHVVFIPPVTGG